MAFTIRQPRSETDFSRYYQLRWEILRAPWQQPLGSEKDEQEDTAHHLLAEDESNRVVGVARLHWNSPDQAQIRYMAVTENVRGTGVGKALLNGLEAEALRRETQEIILHARESVTSFYNANGYELVEPSHLLFDEIQHFLMKKRLTK